MTCFVGRSILHSQQSICCLLRTFLRLDADSRLVSAKTARAAKGTPCVDDEARGERCAYDHLRLHVHQVNESFDGTEDDDSPGGPRAWRRLLIGATYNSRQSDHGLERRESPIKAGQLYQAPVEYV